ncbi:uncharacterized protein LOC130772139 [Actinidia eriantha]|uniref:uncharacterized protein LOC130772139 n=1 Tax=Actinidia eriantha TaxID=165200 RepID=UPI002587AE5F|nr:uncharacterized protein LOC130772139 [Actinidia eriantha]
MADNFSYHPNGQILVIWKEELVTLDIVETSDQAIHCLSLGDFNMLSNEERANGMLVSMYETREFKDCCYDLGLTNLTSTGSFFTWTNNSVWNKEELQQAQLQLHNDPPNSQLQVDIQNLRAKALNLAEVEMSYCSQLAKAKFLKNNDKELLRHYSRKKSSPKCTFNVDLRKAFDSVDWNFIKDMLIAQHFPSSFISWIMTCIEFTSYSISYNGSLHGFFKGERGLRQGDPLSHYFFVLCLEYLSRSLGELYHNPDFNFHLRYGGLKIMHLAYADDLVLFSRGDPTSVSILMDKLNHFGDYSGLNINLTKSSFHSASISDADLEIIKGITGFSQGSFPFKYLGIPVADSRLTIAQYSPLIDRILDNISA